MDTEKIEQNGTSPQEMTEELPKTEESATAPEPSPKKKLTSKAIAGIVAGVAAVAIVAGVGIYAVANPAQGSAPAAEQAEQVQADTEVQFAIDAPDWDQDSSAAIAHIAGKTYEGDDVDFYHAFQPAEEAHAVTLASGDYEVEWVTPINSDGSLYKVPEKQELKVPTVDKGEASNDESASDDATNDEAATDEGTGNADAGTSGDQATEEPSDGSTDTSADEDKASGSDEPADTSDDQGSAEDASTNEGTTDESAATDEPAAEPDPVKSDASMEKVPADQVSADDLSKALDQIGEAVSKGDGTLTGEAGTAVADKAAENASKNPNADKGAVEEKKQQAEAKADEAKPSESKANTGAEAGSGSTSGSSQSGNKGTSSSSSSSSSSSVQSQPAHTHTKVAVTKTVHHDAVTHQKAIVKTVPICYTCGEANPSKAHLYQHAIYHRDNHGNAKDGCGSTYAKDQTVGYETVIDKAAYDETVTVGYKCSTCGASL